MERTELFKAFVEELDSGKYQTPLDVPGRIFQDRSWLDLDRKEYFDRFHGFIEWQVRRAASKTSIYSKSVAEEISRAKVESYEDFLRLPGMPKDATMGGVRSLRDTVALNPRAILPTDIPRGVPTTPYYSGGTKGNPVPTWITNLDREIESSAFALLMEECGIGKGSTVFWCYNTQGHKGGWEGIEALDKLGCETVIPKSQLKAPEISKQIHEYRRQGRKTVLVTVPILEADKQNKGSGRTLGDFISADADLHEKVDLVLLGGDRMTPSTLDWLDTPFSIDTSAIYGATEVLPLLYSSPYPKDKHLPCTRNDMHPLYGPHIGEIVKNENGVLVPVKKNERGMVAITNVFRQGTPYTRLLIGDGAELGPDCEHKTEVWSSVQRETIPSDIQTACAGD